MTADPTNTASSLNGTTTTTANNTATSTTNETKKLQQNNKCDSGGETSDKNNSSDQEGGGGVNKSISTSKNDSGISAKNLGVDITEKDSNGEIDGSHVPKTEFLELSKMEGLEGLMDKSELGSQKKDICK